ncbi:hypothetical protein [Thiosulfativibrio zosterae]|uniref:Uncharacterized protein n=1 Tax=Thiosulfativibrio zosterae TaxID=2675053 RepID=A0A6F8PRD6_9GAMM|nr:hypothetical protein [Thiosulfativibrio zosterae]BBP44550.1 hypothetical protein THMIRHAT_22960 [Thiosulfativibrio zosterae]
MSNVIHISSKSLEQQPTQNTVLSCDEFIQSLPFFVDELTHDSYLGHLLDIEPVYVEHGEDHFCLSQHLFAFMTEFDRITTNRQQYLKSQYATVMQSLEVTP